MCFTVMLSHNLIPAADQSVKYLQGLDTIYQQYLCNLMQSSAEALQQIFLKDNAPLFVQALSDVCIQFLGPYSLMQP